MSEPRDYHTPVLLEEVLSFFPYKKDAVFLDGTLGGGGHFRAMAERFDSTDTLIGIDRDPEAVLWNRQRMPSCRSAVILEQSRFSEFDQVLTRHKIASLDGILLDLGVSSHQIDSPDRGFSYMLDGDLDMRMDPAAGVPATALIRDSSAEELAAILRDFGEVRGAAKIAAAIKRRDSERGICSAADLRACFAGAVLHRSSIKLIAKVFQALRIAVNGELEELRHFLAKVSDFLKPGGRLAVIAYHSLEDRIVKNYFQVNERACSCPPELPQCVCKNRPLFKRITKKAVRPSALEIRQNRRSRSARLRVAERTGVGR